MFSYVVKNNMIWLDLLASVCISIENVFKSLFARRFCKETREWVRQTSYIYTTKIRLFDPNDTRGICTTLHTHAHIQSINPLLCALSSQFVFISHSPSMIQCTPSCVTQGTYLYLLKYCDRVVFHRFFSQLLACQSNLSYHITYAILISA